MKKKYKILKQKNLILLVSKSKKKSQNFYTKNGHWVHMILRFHTFLDLDSRFSFWIGHMKRAKGQNTGNDSSWPLHLLCPFLRTGHFFYIVAIIIWNQHTKRRLMILFKLPQYLKNFSCEITIWRNDPDV